jgi:arylsulfatase A-like enzyme
MRRALLLATLALLAGACGGDGGPPPNVLVITLDTVRADRFETYGAARAGVTPRLDAFAAECVVFEDAFANSSFTPPTHASIFTSLYPAEHGLMWWNRKLADVPTGAESFRVAGYRTLAFTPLRTLFALGLDRGFEQALDVPYSMEDEQLVLADADAINAEAVPALTARDKRPFFAWVHYYDAHRPFGRQGPEWSGRFTAEDDPTVGDDEGWYQLTPEMRAEMGLTPEQTQLIKDHYDGGLAYLDDRVGEMLDALDEAGVLEGTIVVLIADHGEVLDEHDEQWFAHDPYLVDENLRIPFLMRLPGGKHAGTRVPGLVSQVDVLPTLYELAGVEPLPPARLSGTSLVPWIEGGENETKWVFSERMGDDRDGRSPDRRYAVRGTTRKLTLHEENRATVLSAVDGSHPESRNLVEQEKDAVIPMSVVLERWAGSMRKAGVEGGGDVDDSMRQMLIEMGYIDDSKPGGDG